MKVNVMHISSPQLTFFVVNVGEISIKMLENVFSMSLFETQSIAGNQRQRDPAPVFKAVARGVYNIAQISRFIMSRMAASVV